DRRADAYRAAPSAPGPCHLAPGQSRRLPVHPRRPEATGVALLRQRHAHRAVVVQEALQPRIHPVHAEAPRGHDGYRDHPDEARGMNRHRTWTPEEDATVTRLWNENVRAAEIGEQLGRTVKAVEYRARNLGLPARPHMRVAAAARARASIAARATGYAKRAWTPQDIRDLRRM